MATIKGKWILNDEIAEPTAFSQAVSFTTNNTLYSAMSVSLSEMAGTPVLRYGNAIVFDLMGFDADFEGWKGEEYRTVDFGTTEQTVSDAFRTFMETYATPEAEPTPTDAVTIEYNGSVIASLKAGQSATLPCKDKPMLSDVVITAAAESGGDSGGNTGGGGSSDPTKFVSVDDFVLHNFGEYAANRNVEITMRTSYSNPAQTKTISVSGGELNRTHYMFGMTALYNARAADNLAYCQTIAPSGATVARTSAGFQGKAEIIFNILGFDGTNYNAEVWCIYRSSTTPTLVKGAKATYEDGWFVINIPDVIDDGGVTITYADGTTEKPVDYNAFYTAFKIVDKGSV